MLFTGKHKCPKILTKLDNKNVAVPHVSVLYLLNNVEHRAAELVGALTSLAYPQGESNVRTRHSN